MKLQELVDNRVKLVREARSYIEQAESRDGGATQEDLDRHAAMLKDIHTLGGRITAHQDQERLEAEVSRTNERRSDPLAFSVTGGDGVDERGKRMTAAEFRASDIYSSIYENWMATGTVYAHNIPVEYRDTVLGTDAKGGFLKPPVQMADEVVKMVDNLTFIRQLATIKKLKDGKAFGIPRLTSRMSDANWTSEVAAVTEDTALAVDRRDLTPFLLSKLAKISIRAIEAGEPIQSTVLEELAYAFSVTEEKAYLLGSGTGQPLGIFTASANGVPTARDVSTGNTTTAIGADNIRNVKYSLKAQYRRHPSLRWIFSRTAVNQLMLLKDAENRYLWKPSLTAGGEDTLEGIPILESEFAPATFTTGLYVGALACLRWYWIAEVETAFSMQRLVELYAATSEIGYIGRRFLDGAPVLAEAFARVKLA